MKTKFILLTVISMLLSNANLQAQKSAASKKILVAYFSYSGNTQVIADLIKAETGADIFRIEPAKAYPQEYNSVVEQAKKEIEGNYKPAIKGKVENMESYDVIFVGSPNWWNTIAPPVSTFLSSYNLAGKTVIPFITHEGSRMGRSVADIKKLCPRSTVKDGLPIRGGSVNKAKDEVKKWLLGMELIK